MSDTFALPLLEWRDIPAGRVTIVILAHYTEYNVKAFRIGKYPVTYAQFQAFVEAPDGFRSDVWWQGLDKREAEPGQQRWPVDNHPRENVSWYDAVAFCRWLSNKTGLVISLPTEQQWQRAAQGDDARQYPWGKLFDESRCNQQDNLWHSTTPVDKYPDGASPYGVYDMAGNVMEWCLNEYKNPSYVGFIGNADRVLRGGYYDDSWASAQCFSRHWDAPDARRPFIGFRIVAVSSPY